MLTRRRIVRSLADTSPRIMLMMAAVYLAAVLTGYYAAPLDPAAFTVTPVPIIGTAVHNLRVIAILSLGGIGLVVPTLIAGAWNGFLTGALLAALVATPCWLVAMLAHGIPEVVGQWCAMVGGAELCIALLGWLRQDRAAVPTRAATWIGMAIGLTCIAAVIESTISFRILTAHPR